MAFAHVGNFSGSRAAGGDGFYQCYWYFLTKLKNLTLKSCCRPCHVAQMEGLRGALDGSGRLLGRLRADVRGLQLRGRGGALAAAAAAAEQSLARLQARVRGRGRTGEEEEEDEDEEEVEAEEEAVAASLLQDADAATQSAKPSSDSADGATNADAAAPGTDLGSEPGAAAAGGAAAGRGPLVSAAAVSTARRLLSAMGSQMGALQQQLEAEAGLRAAAERELAELRRLFDGYVASAVARVQQAQQAAAGGGAS